MTLTQILKSRLLWRMLGAYALGTIIVNVDNPCFTILGCLFLGFLVVNTVKWYDPPEGR